MASYLLNKSSCKLSKSPFLLLQHYSNNFIKDFDHKKCYKILGISEDSDQEQIRSAYLKLVKKYHPDSGSDEANSEKFHQIDNAFKTLINKKCKERWEVDEELIEKLEIKHTAPQHRQYLSYDGYGAGTPFQRQKQYTKMRAMQASENVMQHRISKATAEEGALLSKKPLQHKIKTKYGFDRLVEDLIQESISKGEFSKLSGVGKPLSGHENRNPFVDFVTHKLNEVLIENGFTPEWITLHKEIREQIQLMKNNLANDRSFFGKLPLSALDQFEWNETVQKYDATVLDINKKIDKFNLVVPILNKQMTHICLKRESEKILMHGKTTVDFTPENRVKKIDIIEDCNNTKNKSDNIFSLFEKIFY